MEDPTWTESRIERRFEKKGLRPRIAASVIASVWISAIVVFGIVEHIVDPDTFDTIWLGMWWATQTVTTVGYGDVVPEQASGQLIAVILMIGGLSLFSVITGVITSVFVARAQAGGSSAGGDGPAPGDRPAPGDSLEPKLDRVVAELEEVRRQLSRLQSGDSSSPPDEKPG